MTDKPRTLSELAVNDEANIVRRWLADRGFVAVERSLGEYLARTRIAYYDPATDRYHDISKHVSQLVVT